MTCPVTVRLGVYALGAVDAGERVLVETHLLTCQACRSELARLQPLPGLLARVPANLLRADQAPVKSSGRAPITRTGDTRAGKARSSAGRWRSVAGVVAAAALGAAGGFWLAPQGASQPHANSPSAGITLRALTLLRTYAYPSR
ncbi:MAG TPA: zf-HC2 domain-containing protein [Streptosporangiaceae bacterium]|nr:zf-HC2 domain-containing protein [Streptosporangiaceae bacterium]